MQLPLMNSSGQSVGTIEVNDGLFDVPMNQALVHQVAMAHRANARQGHVCHQDQRYGVRRRREAVAAEAHRPRPPGQPSCAPVERRRA